MHTAKNVTRRHAVRAIAGGMGLLAAPWSAFAKAESDVPPLPTSDEIEKVLWEKLLAIWYPRCLDVEHGGFLENFAFDWSAKPTRSKCLIFQGRMTWVPAHIVLNYERDRHQQRVYCLHGLEFLRRGMWDPKHGGFLDQVAAPGGPDPSVEPVKQMYSTAFGIYAAAAAYEATRRPEALELARDAFAWIEQHAHDREHGGYFEHLARDGKPLATAPTEEDFSGRFMVIGKVGRKSMNAHIHLLEALTALRRVWDDRLLLERLEELFVIVRDKIVMPGGHLNMFAERDFTPIDEQSSFGHELEIAYLLAEADELLHGHVSEETAGVAKRVVDHALQWGWDAKDGGFFYEGPPAGPPDKREKSWWVLPEAMNGLLTVHRLPSVTDPRYLEYFARTWKFFYDKQVDHRYGECYGSLGEGGLPMPPDQDKANRWKAAYHNVRGLVHASRAMRKAP
ncbi:MAG: AGE family epimerase/isomerase [Thermoguttaceae bacterium]